MTHLSPGDTFPDLRVARVGGGTVSLPGDLAGRYGVVLVNRGAWCPYCNAQLRAFQRALPELDAVGASVVAFSVDSEDVATEMVARNTLTFPVGHSADAATTSAAIGSFVNAHPAFLQSTGFVLDPSGRVLVSVYSSGAIGRLVPEDVVGLIRYAREHAAAG
jgi:peroxiredoxin